MGEVFAAENIRTGRPVAVKLLRSESKAKSSAVARFRREAKAAGAINSDHVTEILDVEEDPEHGIVLVFELLEGESLIERLKRTGPIPFDELYVIVEQVWIGLADAHKVGIIHRDLKPSNVFLERRPDGQTRVKILDFGISKLPKEMGGETLTEMGQSLGTFSFMPPEQIGKAKTVDHRADIYASATLIYQALSGQLPYAARNILVMVEMKNKMDPRKLSDALGDSVDPRLEAFLSRALARDPDERFQNALEALTAWRELKVPSGGGGGGGSSGGGGSNPPLEKAPSKTSGNASTMAMPQLSAASLRSNEQSGRRSTAAEQLPMLNETSDTAATLAMPLANFSYVNDPPRRESAPPAPPTNNKAPTPLNRLSKTIPLNAESPALAIALAQQAARNSSYGEPDGGQNRGGPRYPSGPQRAPSGTFAMPQVPMPSQGSAAAALQGAPPNAAANVYEEGTVDSPPSLQKTRVYNPGPATARSGDPAPGSLIRQLQRGTQRRSAAPFILGAIAFALVGFGIVALIMNYYWR
jgi:serine/threonine-protein kinase